MQKIIDIEEVDWSFAGITGKFDRSSSQRGYQVYKEVCASCHSIDRKSGGEGKSG